MLVVGEKWEKGEGEGVHNGRNTPVFLAIHTLGVWLGGWLVVHLGHVA
jgi:hypothetical protein